MGNINIGKNVRLGKNVVITGDVEIGGDTSIWHNVVLRGDVAPIRIGKKCNIQDGTILHGQLNEWEVEIGDNVSIGHGCLLHGCRLIDESFIGMGSIVMNGAVIGKHVMVAAGSLIPEGKHLITSGVLVMGRPGKVIRELKEKEILMIKNTPQRYLDYAQQWLPDIIKY